MSLNNTQCAHDWIISLTQQDEESRLDETLIDALNSILSAELIAVYVNKLTSKQQPCIINKGHITLPWSISTFNRMLQKAKKSKLHFFRFEGVNISYLPINHASVSIGYALIYSYPKIDFNNSFVAMKLLHIYSNQLFLLHKVRVDPLTQLLNRQTFDNKIMEIVDGQGFLSKRKGELKVRSWHLAMMDIDFFKKVNDSFGHVIGDEILLLVSQIIKNNFRSEDYVFRYGGEEFAVIFQCELVEKAVDVLERLRAEIEKYSFPKVNNVTISIGFTTLIQCELTAVLVQKADLALYHSKNSGRNRISNFANLEQHIDSMVVSGNKPELF